MERGSFAIWNWWKAMVFYGGAWRDAPFRAALHCRLRWFCRAWEYLRWLELRLPAPAARSIGDPVARRRPLVAPLPLFERLRAAAMRCQARPHRISFRSGRPPASGAPARRRARPHSASGATARPRLPALLGPAVTIPAIGEKGRH